MKKVLEDELMSLAHSILKLRNRSDIHELKIQTGLLYEKLSVLSFAEKHFNSNQPSIGKKEFVSIFEEALSTYKEENSAEIEAEEVSVEKEQTTVENFETPQPTSEKAKETDVKETPAAATNSSPTEDAFIEESESNAKKEEQKATSKQDDPYQDFGVHYDDLPDFEPATEKAKSTEKPAKKVVSEKETPVVQTEKSSPETPVSTPENKEEQANSAEEKSVPYPESSSIEEIKTDDEPVQPQKTIDLFSDEKKSLNEQLKRGIKIGLNDRIAFTKQLFDGNVSDYNRVLSQLNTMETFADAKNFLEQAVKPEYKNWEGKEAVEERFLSIIEARFQ
ncbi:MAG: hypothetical protein ACQESK_04785 [Bacteroidota bacterium]